MKQSRSTFRAFVVALLAMIVMVFLRHFVFIPILEFNPPIMPAILAVMLAAWIGGIKSGLFATVLGAGMLYGLLGGEAGFAFVPTIFQTIRLGLFVVIGGLISWGADALTSARQRIDDRQRELEKELFERRRAEDAEKRQREQLTAEMGRRELAENELKQQEETIRLAADSGDIGVWDFNPLTGEHKWSARSKEIFGLAPDADIGGLSFLDRVHSDDRDRVNETMQSALDPSGDGKYRVEYRVPWPDGTVHWVLARGQALFQGDKDNRQPIRGIGTVLDITERKHAEETLRASENRLRAIMDNTSAVIYLKDAEGRYLMTNRRYEELFKVTQQQIVGKTDADIFPSEVVEALQANDRQVRDSGQSLEFEEVVPHEDGPHTYVSVKFPIVDDAGRCSAVGGISTDISDRKRAADALAEEQDLLRHTIEIQDQERQLIAYEIHDGLVQYATGALMQLESIRDKLQSEPIAEQLENVVSILRKTVAEGRRIINGIHTTILDDCGVVAAVEQLIEDEERAHVHIDFIKDEGLGRMAPSIELALYHITQEALTNVYKHSQSDKVRIELSRRDDNVHLEVRDWGVGFAPPGSSKGIHGLRGMTERARIAGGKCTIQNARGKGTKVVVDLPYLSRN